MTPLRTPSLTPCSTHRQAVSALCTRAALIVVAVVCVALGTLPGRSASAAEVEPIPLQLRDVFQLEYAADPRISPKGEQIIYVRTAMDIMKDRRRGVLWIIDVATGKQRPLLGGGNAAAPRWSPQGDQVLFVATEEQRSQIFVHWLDPNVSAPVTQLESSPSNLAWSPDGTQIAFTMRVNAKKAPLVDLPSKPDGATWAEPPREVDTLVYRRDGRGFDEPGFHQVFVVPASGGSPRQLTQGEFSHQSSLSWSGDGAEILFSANRRADWEYERNDTEIYAVDVASAEMRQLTDRRGPDGSPRVSPDGKWMAYLGYDDRYRGYQLDDIFLMRMDGSERRCLTEGWDRQPEDLQWAADGKSLWVQYSDQGNGKLGQLSLAGEMHVRAHDVGGTSLGRPYSSGSFTLSRSGAVAFNTTRPEFPAEVAYLGGRQDRVRRLTHLNEDLLGKKTLAKVEQLWVPSPHDQRNIQAWLATPPGFDPDKKYPLILEIHGGPFANYGDRFAAEIQLYAAAGYVVLYANPRGSSSYGEEFGDLIHHAYPSYDYDDLMGCVDAVVSRGFVDPSRLYVTGGSGGGVLTAWIVGKTNRFRAAVVAKPVINWFSFVLTADMSPYFARYWFPKMPWEDPEHYYRRSPISLVGNVQTPTLLLTGEDDLRTPMPETEQFYQALKLRRVDTLMVRIPGASHGIASRPSQLIAKVAYVLGWFEKHGGDDADGGRNGVEEEPKK